MKSNKNANSSPEGIRGVLLAICEMYAASFLLFNWELQFYNGSEWVLIVDKFFMAN